MNPTADTIEHPLDVLTPDEPLQFYQITGSVASHGQLPRTVIGSRLATNEAEAVGMFVLKHALKGGAAAVATHPTVINPANN